MRKQAVSIVLLFLFACLPFLPTLKAEFLNWDDDFYLTENPDIVSPEGWSETLVRFTTDANVYPVVFATFRLEHRLWGFNPVGFHAVNVVLHGLVAVSCFFLLTSFGIDRRIAWWAALIFAVHPIQVATVAWISERKSLLGTLFILLSWMAFRGALRRGGESPSRNRLLIAFSLLLACLAYLSKSSLVVFPILLFGVQWIRKEPFPLWGWTHFLVAGVVGWIYTGRETGPAISFFDRSFLAARSFWYYVGRAIAPLPDGGVRPKWDASVFTTADALALAGLVLLVGVVYSLRRRVLAVEWIGLALFVVPLAPSLGFLSFGYQQHAFVSDHFAYLAMLGFCLIAASILFRTMRSKARARTALLALIAVLFTTLSWAECEVWKTSENFWTATLAANPESWAAHQNLATELDRQGRLAEAQEHYEEAVRIEPNNPVGWINLGRSQIRGGSEEQAVDSLHRAIELNPHYREAYGFLAEALSRLGRFEEALEARKMEQDLRE